MPVVSIITAAYAPSAQFLGETALSVAAQEMPDGWSVEWIVQEDGEQPELSRLFDDVPNARYEANGGQLGLAVTRNLALSRATGGLVQVLDHDDLLLPGATALLASRFVENQIHWAVGQADDLMPDGARLSYPSALGFGIVAAGVANDWAAERNGNWPIHCAGLMMRTESVRVLGGWAGLPAEDDISLFAALSEVTDGYCEESMTWLYRQHATQTYRSEAWRSRSAVGRRAALQRARAMRSARVQIGAVSLERESAPDVEVGRSIKTPRQL
ncbi:Glycosyl transferase family 2 [Lentzea albidocapillata subsp. violacea]|uniref:Glycosyl transferase family 2 n=1 Tax=Lentzea albidocapillata subsp. violacea TaxID=128104 RepID=A0A1G9UU35_9PSEU|nr:glycosyltransferase family A protein [Lentzea albidocapillata]SDM63359.1 Glycosyl transferase family 2 [Lentzea albidocapillata subsp. violacea]